MSLLMGTWGIGPKGPMQDPDGPVETGQAHPDMFRGELTRAGIPQGAVQVSQGTRSPGVTESYQCLFVVSPILPMCVPSCFPPAQTSSVQGSSQFYILKRYVTQTNRCNAEPRYDNTNG
ncbi:hypothetical protein FKM82_023891 [Ascaphus truei]